METYDKWQKRSPRADALLKRVRQEVLSIVPEADIVLYGSHGRGEADELSDWDFLILVDRPLDREMITTIRDRLYDLELETDTVLSSIIRTRAEWHSPQYAVFPFKRIVEEEGVLL